MGEYEQVTHTFEPVYNKDSRILILGSFPSVKSREAGFYYYHPQNRFWKVISTLVGEETPDTIERKKRLLLDNHIAVWDVIASCDIIGSSDSSIRNVVPVDVERITKTAKLQKIYANGATAAKLYQKYLYPITGKEVITLPSTSPANAAFSLDRLCQIWERVIKEQE